MFVCPLTPTARARLGRSGACAKALAGSPLLIKRAAISARTRAPSILARAAAVQVTNACLCRSVRGFIEAITPCSCHKMMTSLSVHLPHLCRHRWIQPLLWIRFRRLWTRSRVVYTLASVVGCGFHLATNKPACPVSRRAPTMILVAETATL